MPPIQNGLKLPAKLVSELGGQDVASSSRGPRRIHTSRKDIRKAERVQKKALRNGPPPHKRAKTQHISVPTSPQSSDSEEPLQSDGNLSTAETPKAPITKTNRSQIGTVTPSLSKSRSVTPLIPEISLAVKHKLEEDDEEIAALEKKLGLKGKKNLPQSFRDDGLDELLQGLDSDYDVAQQQVRKEKSEQKDWLIQKRRQARVKAAEVNIQDNLIGSGEEFSGLDDDSGSGDSASENEDHDVAVRNSRGSEDFYQNANESFEGFGSDSEPTAQPRVRENPYVAPVSNIGNLTTKYVPPSLRKAVSSETEALTRLRRQTQGLVNRLTEANLLSILAEIEKIYRDNPRQHVTSTLVDLLLAQVCEPTSLPDTSIIVPAGFIAAVYKVIGVDFGAQVMQRTIELFDEHYTNATKLQSLGGTGFDSKETSNLITLLSELYNFQVIGSNLMFDYVRLFLGKLTELNAELLLRVVRISGPQLRQDDPSALKEIVSMLGPAVASVGEANLSVRTKFMIEAITNLKNNRNKSGGAISAINSEHLTKMKKTLGTLNTRSVKASEPLRMGLKDVQDADKKGKWWLVGASWSGPAAEGGRDGEAADTSTQLVNQDELSQDVGTSDLVHLASQHRMNTDIRRAIFITIMSASDYQDAYLRLMKLRLKKVQELEIPKVLVRCSGSEKAYNPYYTLIARKLCGDRKLKMAFQFSLWDLFRRMGENDESDETLNNDSEEDDLNIRRIVNLGKMYGALVADGGLSLGVLKNLNLNYLQTKTKTFVEILIISVFLQLKRQSKSEGDEQVAKVFSRIKEHPPLIRGFQYFLKKVVSKTDIAGSKADTATVKKGCKTVGRILDEMVASDSAVPG